MSVTPTVQSLTALWFDRERFGPVPEKALNPCELEIDLFCKGMRIDALCHTKSEGRPILRTRAGLGSGLEMIIPGPLKDIWVNAPVEESFAKQSCYRLVSEPSGFYIHDDRQGFRYRVELSSEPKWYQRNTSRGVPMHRVGVLQGTYLGIYISNSCGFWYHSPAVNCKFCTTGLNVGVNEQATKDIEDVVEVAQAAKQESGISFVHFNSGYQTNRDLDRAAPYVKAVKSRVGSLIGVQLTPSRDLWKYDQLIDLGADHFSFCYEFQNPEYFARICPGKQQLIGQEAFFRALEYTAKKLGKGACSGEIIAGIEPIEDTLKAIDFIAGLGAFPTVCIFRPTVGADMEDWPPPRYEDMLVVFRHLYEACRKNNIPMDVTPNIEVSLVVQPGDTRYLAPDSTRASLYNAKMKILKNAAKPYFLWKGRKRKISAPDTLIPPEA